MRSGHGRGSHRQARAGEIEAEDRTACAAARGARWRAHARAVRARGAGDGRGRERGMGICWRGWAVNTKGVVSEVSELPTSGGRFWRIFPLVGDKTFFKALVHNVVSLKAAATVSMKVYHTWSSRVVYCMCGSVIRNVMAALDRDVTTILYLSKIVNMYHILLFFCYVCNGPQSQFGNNLYFLSETAGNPSRLLSSIASGGDRAIQQKILTSG